MASQVILNISTMEESFRLKQSIESSHKGVQIEIKPEGAGGCVVVTYPEDSSFAAILAEGLANAARERGIDAKVLTT